VEKEEKKELSLKDGKSRRTDKIFEKTNMKKHKNKSIKNDGKKMV